MIPGAFPSSFPQQLADLLRRVSELERKQTSGTGISTLHGTVSSRTMQPGLPAELTSSWNASTGYSAKQLTLEGVGLVNPTVQPTFDYVVTPDGNTSLASGAKGWLEADPQTGGWLFIRSPSTSSGIFGQDSSTPGGLMVWADDTGQWAGEAKGLVFRNYVGAFQTLTGPTSHLYLFLPHAPVPVYAQSVHNHLLSLSVEPIVQSASSIFSGVAGTSDLEMNLLFFGKSGDGHAVRANFVDGAFVGLREEFRLENNSVSGRIETYRNPAAPSTIIRRHVAVNNWMAHHTSTGTAGVTGTIRAGATISEGIVTNLGTVTSAYSVSNVTTDRSYDANATTLDEVADVLGTLIQDLQAKGVLG